MWPIGLKYMLSGPLQKKFANPWLFYSAKGTGSTETPETLPRSAPFSSD